VSDIDRLQHFEVDEHVPFVLEAIRLVRDQLPENVPLIGFAGAPFTLASYLVEGKASRTFSQTKRLMYSQPEVWHKLLRRLAGIVAAYLKGQIAAGVQVVQLFDSWVGCLSLDDYSCYVQPYSRLIFESLPSDIPTIHFGLETGGLLEAMAEAGGSVIGLDWRIPLHSARQRLGPGRAVQGNLDPLVLLGPWKVAEAAAGRVLQQAGGRPGHIFNLGHGLHPETPLDNVARLVDFVHAWRLTP
jgi:uroporphyrinogen decarboxylase